MVSEKSIWYALTYYRLSKDDCMDKDSGNTSDQQGNQQYSGKESNSIMNQRKLIQEFISGSEDIIFVEEFFDDGFTGTNFDRPSFKRLMNEVRNGRINCVIVKDLSRFGRNYIEVGNYLEKIFPFMGIRFISVVDSLDSFVNPGQMNTVVVPFKNMLNDAYCQDVSNKVRHALDDRRRSGKFVGSFCAYGFIKDKEHKGELLVDRTVSQVIQNIYQWFLEGEPVLAIARKLNDMGVLTPMEYKKQSGSNYRNPYCEVEGTAVWGYTSVKKILTNRMYCGDLVQGMKRMASYKIKKALTVPKDEWIICENHHEAIVSREDFDRVQQIFDASERQTVKKSESSLLAGFMRCADCGMAMSYCNNHGHRYYICSKYARATKRLCTRHSVRVEHIEKAVLEAIRAQIAIAVEVDALFQALEKDAVTQRQSDRLKELICRKENEIRGLTRNKEDLYMDWKDEILSREEYISMKQNYDEKIDSAQKEIQVLNAKAEEQREIEEVCYNDFVLSFIKHRNIEYLTREVLLELIDTIYVHEDKRISIKFRFRDELAKCREILGQNVLELREKSGFCCLNAMNQI